jgi:hypothetical protein
MLPRAATEHEVDQRDILGVVLGGLARAWRLMAGRTWETAWRNDVGPSMVDLVTEAQQTAAATAEVYVATVLAEMGIESASPSSLNLPAFADVAGDGRSVESLLYGGVVHAAKAYYTPEVAQLQPAPAEHAALDSALAWIEETATTILADAARSAEAVAMAQRPWVAGYIRMLDPKNPCSRCVVLAGKFYLYNDGFERHPACRCFHIPYAENRPHDALTNPNDYFASLSHAEQDRVFTVAGAEAVRLGADVTQVVNARRGMHTAQQNVRGWIPKGRMTPVDAFGREVYVTTEGVTKRAVGRKAMGSGRPFRLMPESVLSIARDRDDAIRLLKLYGYIT